MTTARSADRVGRPRTRARFIVLGIAVYAAIAVVFFVGFATHRSSVAVIGPYTPGYFAFLIALAATLSAPPAAVLLLLRVLGAQRTTKLVGRGVMGLLVAYAVAEVVYASTREHPFDPFLQFPGTRFEGVPQAAEEGVVRIITLGGSTTHNAHLNPPLRYPSVLEKHMNRGETEHEVLNAGMDWWTTKHSHINYITYLRDLEPDIAIVMHGINDLYRSFAAPRFSIGSYDTQWTHFYGPAIRGARPLSLMGATLNQWSVWELNRRWYSRWRYRKVDLTIDAFPSLAAFERNLRSLVQTLVADGVRVILVTQPSMYRSDLNFRERANLWFPATFCATPIGWSAYEIPSVDTMVLAMQAFNDVVLKVATLEGVDVVDAARRIPRDLEHFGDDVHYTENGAAALAEEIAGTISRVNIRTVSDNAR